MRSIENFSLEHICHQEISHTVFEIKKRGGEEQENMYIFTGKTRKATQKS